MEEERANTDGPSGKLLDAPLGARSEWAERVGKPHSTGVKSDIGVSDTQGNGIEYQIRGVVDVPSPPCGDDERGLLANVLFHATEIPHKKERTVRLHGWVARRNSTTGITCPRTAPSKGVLGFDRSTNVQISKNVSTPP